MRMWILKYEYEKWRDKAIQFIVWKLPKRLVYWCAIRVVADATIGKYRETDAARIPAMEALKRWESQCARF